MLLTFIPAAGDFINAQLLGTPRQYMIGNVIQSEFLAVRDYPTAASLSFILMAAILVMVLVFAKVLGTDRLTVARMRFVRHHLLSAYAVLALAYLFLPIAIVIAFSFNNPAGRFNFTWQGFTLKNWENPFGYPGLQGALKVSIEIAFLSALVATAFGTMIALALVRYKFKGSATTNLLIFVPMTTPEVVMGASLLTLFLNWKIPQGFSTILIAHIAFNISYVVVTVRARLVGFDRHLEEAAMDLGANELVTFLRVTLPLIMPGDHRRRPARVRALDRRLRDHVLQRRLDDDVPALRLGRRARRDATADQRDRHGDLRRRGRRR